jgi:uncharacterized protein (TIGR02145 family)
VARDAEWCELENYLDSGPISCDETGFRGTDAGGKLKEAGTAHWHTPNTGATNSSGFSALPGGYATNGISNGINEYGYFWTSTPSWGTNVDGRMLGKNYAYILRESGFWNTNGFSVRCMKD